MKTVIIISRLLKTKKDLTTTYSFHFKGVYMGLQVNSLELIYEHELKKGHDYVLRVSIHSLEAGGVLKGKILYAKDLDDITSHWY